MLKSASLILIFWLVFLLPCQAENRLSTPLQSSSVSGAQYRWTLAEAKALALQRNPSIAQTQAGIERAAALLQEAEAAYWPTLDLNASITRWRDRASRPVRDYDNNTRYSSGLGAQWLLFDGFQRKFATLGAKYGLESSTQAHYDVQRLLLQAVSSAFYAALLAQDNMEIARQDADFNAILLEDAKKRHAGGIAPPSEVLNFELQVGKARVDYIASERSWQSAIVVLAALLATSEDQIWRKVELVPPPAELLRHEISLPKLLAYALRQRPDLLMADNAILRSQAAVQAQRGSWYPRISLFSDYSYEREASLHFNKHLDRNVSFGVVLNWNLFEGHRTSAAVAAAEAELQSALQSRQSLLLEIESELRRNLLAWDSSRRQQVLQEDIFSTATRIRDLVHQEYLGGTTTITRLNEVQSDVTKSAAARSSSYVQVLNNLEQLAASSGLILKEDYLQELGEKRSEN